MLKVIGAGFGRTGTLSLKFALEQLGFGPCYHMMEVRGLPEHRDLWQRAHRGQDISWDALFEGYQATVDWPSCNHWRDQLAHFPDAKVILTLRDSERWYASIMNTIYGVTAANAASDDTERQAGAAWAMEIIWDRLFDGRMNDKQHVISVFDQHNAAVMEEVPVDRLLVYEPGQGWDPLCDFLEVEAPDEDYPRVNSTEEFHDRWQTDQRDGSDGDGVGEK